MRTDVHSSSQIKPEDYSLIGYICHMRMGAPGAIDIEQAKFIREQREIIRAFMEAVKATWSSHEHGGKCHICGNSLCIDMAAFYHKPSNTMIKVGLNCAEKLEMGDARMFNIWRKERAAWTEFQTGKRKAQAVLAEKKLEECWQFYVAEDISGFKFEENTIRDIVGKLVTYGSISENQENFLRKLLVQLNQRSQVEAQRAAEHEAATECPSGRIEIIGVIKSIKTVDTAFGVQEKMLVQHESGWKVWGSVPSNLAASRGDKVRFIATVEVSKDDTKFGFFKRPTKSELLETCQEEVAA